MLRRLIPLLTFTFALLASGQTEELPIRGLAIAAPNPEGVERFVEFIDQELAPRGINTLVLRVDYRYEYESQPELRAENPLTRSDIKQIVSVAKRHEIQLVPQINLLGHQSWAEKTGRLLTVYPEFDETPDVEMPEEYEWPNEDGLYCKSYCPLHPDVHAVVFPLVDELLDVFEADAFHAGMDEVFYIGEDQCPRCRGKDKAELFANEVKRIRDHLAESDRRLWIWGDRLLNADTTGIGMWEAAANGTDRAIDLIPKDVLICDWHYVRAEATPAYFALKGLDVVACPWDIPEVGLAQREQALNFRANSNPTLAKRHKGILHTYWSGAERFMDLYESDSPEKTDKDYGPIKTLKALFPKDGDQ